MQIRIVSHEVTIPDEHAGTFGVAAGTYRLGDVVEATEDGAKAAILARWAEAVPEPSGD